MPVCKTLNLQTTMPQFRIRKMNVKKIYHVATPTLDEKSQCLGVMRLKVYYVTTLTVPRTVRVRDRGRCFRRSLPPLLTPVIPCGRRSYDPYLTLKAPTPKDDARLLVSTDLQ